MSRQKVLIVEDDDDLRRGLAALLGRDYEVCVAEDGISAMVLARRERPAAIVLDLGLPGGDGLTVLRWLQEIPALTFTPKIVVTGQCGDAITNAYDAGASFVFEKPADMAELVGVLRRCTELAEPVRKNLLIVDDDVDVRAGLAVRLRAHDFRVWEAADGAAAVAMARKIVPDLVLLDLHLPGGDGLSVLRRLRALDGLGDVPVIALSGMQAETAASAVIEAGADAFLTKPTSDLQLMEAIGAML
ncbi:MAG: response regulator [Planctomycetota bacterium]